MVLPRRHGWILVLALAASCSVEPVVEESVEPTLSAADSVAPTVGSPEPSASMLPDLPLPGTSPNEPAGEYGWTGALGSIGGMHYVVEDLPSAPGEFRQIQLVFAVRDDCVPSATGAEQTAVTVAGLDGWYVEPYDGPLVLFMPERESGQTTGAYALAVGDRTLCVYLTWDPTTTQAELESARQVVESIRGQPFRSDGIRINFTLPRGWDTG